MNTCWADHYGRSRDGEFALSCISSPAISGSTSAASVCIISASTSCRKHDQNEQPIMARATLSDSRVPRSFEPSFAWLQRNVHNPFPSAEVQDSLQKAQSVTPRQVRVLVAVHDRVSLGYLQWLGCTVPLSNPLATARQIAAYELLQEPPCRDAR